MSSALQVTFNNKQTTTLKSCVFFMQFVCQLALRVWRVQCLKVSVLLVMLIQLLFKLIELSRLKHRLLKHFVVFLGKTLINIYSPKWR